MHQMHFTAVLFIHFSTALEETKKERCLHPPAMFVFYLAVTVSRVSLRHLHGDNNGCLRTLDQERRRCLPVDFPLVRPDLLKPRSRQIPRREWRARKSRSRRRRSKVRVHQATLIDHLEQLFEIFDAQPHETLSQTVPIIAGDIAKGKVTHGHQRSGGANADVGVPLKFLDVKNRGRPVLVYRDASRAALCFVNADTETTEPVHFVQVLPETITSDVTSVES
mmetsp:Transcript_31923/g.85433  ORF Transcript_31923/g.85433 Transcript_31923/m.85433 type:complete len:222 (+) Transcript_31923:533-1198(+)